MPNAETGSVARDAAQWRVRASQGRWLAALQLAHAVAVKRLRVSSQNGRCQRSRLTVGLALAAWETRLTAKRSTLPPQRPPRPKQPPSLPRPERDPSAGLPSRCTAGVARAHPTLRQHREPIPAPPGPAAVAWPQKRAHRWARCAVQAAGPAPHAPRFADVDGHRCCPTAAPWRTRPPAPLAARPQTGDAARQKALDSCSTADPATGVAPCPDPRCAPAAHRIDAPARSSGPGETAHR